MNERLKKLRKTLDLTQQEFADKLGSTRDNIGGYETGRRNPSVAVISLICTKFNVNETWLKTGEGNMFNNSTSSDLPLNSDICERFLKIRINLNMKQCDFAKEIKTTQGHVSDIENKRKGVSDRIIEILRLKFSINETWLRTGEGEMFNTLSARLKTLRNTLSLTQQEFADRLNVPRNTIGGYEVGKSNPSDAAVNNICITFNINENWLRTGEGEMFSEPFNNSSIGERIKLLRKELNMTQQKFAEGIHIKRSTIATYESNRNEPIDAVVSLICMQYNVNERWLRTGDGEMFSESFGNSNISERIRILRKKLDMTQQEFAEQLGVKRNTVGQWECGINALTKQVIISICRNFDVNECWLRTGTGEIFVHQTDDEQLASFIVKILANKSTSFKRKFISMLSVLDESDWDVLEKMVTLLKKED